MAEAQDASGRIVKWLRYSAWGLTLTWATCATVVIAYNGLKGQFVDDEFVFCVLPVLLPVLAALVILWRSEGVGGVVLILESLTWLPYLQGIVHGDLSPRSVEEWVFASAGWLPVVAGALFLVIWWKSRTPARPEATE